MSFELDALEGQAQDNAQDILSDIEAEHRESLRQDQEVMETLSEAVRRIEEANLWKTLLTLDVFSVGSARPEIVTSANAKLRQFARENLEICVGIQEKKGPAVQAKEVKLPFDPEETQALKILAAKVLKRDVTKAVLGEYTPQISQVASPTTQTSNIATVKVAQPVNKQSLAQKPSATKKALPVKKSTPKARPGAGYIPPPAVYVPSEQGAATVSSTGATAQAVNMQSLVSDLIQQATGGNVLAQNTSPATDADDVNERF